MDSFEQHLKDTSEKFETNVEGCFDCQECDETQDRAYNDVQTHMLVWKCTNGHISKIKEFYLG